MEAGTGVVPRKDDRMVTSVPVATAERAPRASGRLLTPSDLLPHRLRAHLHSLPVGGAQVLRWDLGVQPQRLSMLSGAEQLARTLHQTGRPLRPLLLPQLVILLPDQAIEDRPVI